MKYGQKLQQRSIPAWSAYNIDYDDVKRFIKDRTITAQDKAAPVSQIGDARIQQTEQELFAILDEQHRRIDLFVKSKAREIQHRLNDAKKRVRQLAARQPPPSVRLSAGRLEKYSRLENDVLKAGEEIKSLARFTSAQRTGFGKLLKKYKKWSGSLLLEDRFRELVLNDPKGFTKHDLGPLLDEYSETLHNIRALYASRLQQTTNDADVSGAVSSYLIGSSIVDQLLASVTTKQKTDFDTAIATVPLGEGGRHATYFVHPDNIVELQVLLMQYMDFHIARSRQNSLAGPISSNGTLHESTPAPTPTTNEAGDYFWLGADDTQRFAQEQSTLNIIDCEARSGSTPQRARISARWTADDDDTALIAARVGETHVQVSKLKRKHVDSFFAKSSSFPPRKPSVATSKHLEELSTIRTPYASDENAKPLFLMSSRRTRLLGLHNSSKHVLLATLDTSITLGTWGDSPDNDQKKVDFPFCVLIVRQEGLPPSHDNVIETLDQSHLVERVAGFSMEYHAIWQVCNPPALTKPFWASLLTHDIRKLPPPALQHTNSITASQALLRSSSGIDGSTGTASILGTGGSNSTTAVETNNSSSILAPSDLENPPLRSFRKKRRRQFPEQQPVIATERYWSEYDHPEDADDENAYVIYIDPNEKSAFDRMLESMSRWFSPHKPATDEERLIDPSPTPKDDESSSDDESRVLGSARRQIGYGTVLHHPRQSLSAQKLKTAPIPFLPQPTISCLAASAVILVVGYILAATGRHKQVREVESGVLFAFASSVLFIIAGVVTLARAKMVQQLGVALAVSTVLIESIAAGGLLAHTIG